MKSSSQTRNGSWVTCIGSSESLPLDHQGSPPHCLQVMWASEGEATAWTQSSCCLSWCEFFVSDPGVWCLLPARTKMWLSKHVTLQTGGKNLRLFTVLDTSTPDFVIHLNTVIFEKKNLLGEPYLLIFHLYFIFGLEWHYLHLCWYKMKVWAAELIQITFVLFPWRVRL